MIRKIALGILLLIVACVLILLYPFIFTKNGESVIVKKIVNGLILPKTGEYILANVLLEAPSNFKWNILTLNNNTSVQVSEIQNDSGPDIFGNKNVFSPNGEKIIFPYNKQTKDYLTNQGFSARDESYDIAIYDIKKAKNTVLPLENKYRLRFRDWPAFLGWISENEIAYSCAPSIDIRQREVPTLQYCTLNLDSNKITVTNTKPKNIIDNTMPIAKEFSSVGCVYNPDKSVCLHLKPRFYVYEGHALYEIWAKKDGKDKMIYRGRQRPGTIYWANDGSAYIDFNYKNIYKFKL
jgi:hypothetical protein